MSAPPAPPLLSAHGLARRHAGGPEVLRGVSLSLANGETLSVVGPSGCGKTTLLYLLCGLARPDEGRVLLEGAPLSGCTPKIAIILQDYGLLPWKTVLGNVALGLKVQGVPRATREARARSVLSELGLSGRERDFPGELSGGEQQRVAIARALASSPRLLLMDEPFSSLDALTREKLQGAVLSLWRARRLPYVLVTHSIEEAVVLGRRILVMAAAPGRIAATFENPGFGDPAFRDDPACFALIREVRRAMEEGL